MSFHMYNYYNIAVQPSYMYFISRTEFHHIPLGVHSLHYEAFKIFVIGFSDKPTKMAKTLMAYKNIVYGRNIKGGCPSRWARFAGVQPLAAHAIWWMAFLLENLILWV